METHGSLLLQGSHPAAEGRLGLRRGGVRKDGNELPAEGRPIRLLQEVGLRRRPHDGGQALVSCTMSAGYDFAAVIPPFARGNLSSLQKLG